jgi:hypothetical protein
MNYKIKRIEIITDINEFNLLDLEIDILIIDILKIYIDDINDNDENYLEKYFFNVKLPILLKHIFINNIEIKINTYPYSLYWNTKLFKKMFKNLKLPFNCKLDAKIIYEINNEYFLFFYSNDNLNELFGYRIKKNDFDSDEKNKKFINKCRYYGIK